MKIQILTYGGIIAISEDKRVKINHYKNGKYEYLIIKLGNKLRIIKYTNIPELFLDLRSRLYYLANHQKLNIEYTPYGKECIKIWYKNVYG